MTYTQTLYVGISAAFSEANTAVVAIAIRDIVYLQDFSVKILEFDGPAHERHNIMTDYIIKELSSYERKIFSKFIGAGIPFGLSKMAHNLCSRLWAELDIVPIALRRDQKHYSSNPHGITDWELKSVDEQADSMARKCIM